jgi:cytoskeletal protein CcmA (bactofilin family)
MIHRNNLLAGLLMAFSLGGTASAASWRTGETVTVQKSEVIQDDLYAAGTDVRIDGTIDGDLIVGAQNVTINGEVRGSLWAAGATVIVNGQVLQSAHLAGSVLRVEKGATIGRDLLAAGSNIEAAPGSLIGRDVAFGGSQAHLGGKVARNVYGGANGIEVGGVIGGDAQLAVSDTRVPVANWNTSSSTGLTYPTSSGTPGLLFLPGGHIVGDLTLQSPKNPVLPAGVVGGKTTYAPIKAVNIQSRPSPFAEFLRTFVGIALAALLLAWLARPRLEGLAQKLRAAPAASLGYGALAFFGLPLAALLGVLVLVALAVSLTLLSLGNLGLPLAFIGAPVLLGVGALISWLALLAAQGFAAYLLGDWIWKTVQPTGKSRSIVLASIGGALLLALLLQIPVLGGLLTFVALLLSLGALWLNLRGPGRQVTAPVVGLPQAT